MVEPGAQKEGRRRLPSRFWRRCVEGEYTQRRQNRRLHPPPGPGLACELRGDSAHVRCPGPCHRGGEIRRSALPAPPDGPSADVHACASGRRSFRARTARRPTHPTARAASSAPSRHSSRTGHPPQNALAAAMSSSCSEKNSSVIDPLPSLQQREVLPPWFSGWSRSLRLAGWRTSPLTPLVSVAFGLVCALRLGLQGGPSETCRDKQEGRRVAPTAW